MKCFSSFNTCNIYENQQTRKPANHYKMEDQQMLNDFSRSLHIKFGCFDNKNNTVKMKLAIMEEVYTLILTPLGRDYIGKTNDFRNILFVKVIEFMNHPQVDPQGHFMVLSKEMLIVIKNLNRNI